MVGRLDLGNMQTLSLSAKLYIIGTILVGSALTAWQISQLRQTDVGLILAVSVLAGVAQILKVEGPTERSSYNISWVAYGFLFLLLGAPATTMVILVAHVMEWIRHKYPWYIQCFNIGSYAIVVSAAGIVYTVLNNAQPPMGFIGFIAAVSAAAAFTWLNHLVVGMVLKLARGQSFAESGVFERLTLAIDFTLFGMGVGAAYIWMVNPYAVLLAAVPLYLVYTTLRVPALQRQSQIDSKTGLFNSKYFTQALEMELARADRHDRPLTVVIADLDLLRNINNTYGHLAGDIALITVARILKSQLRDYDVVARFGGEEFAILMPETAYEQAYPRIEEIRAAIEAARFEVSTSLTPLQVTMSFGIAGRERFGQAPNEIIHCADLAVYQAKLCGRNRICRFSARGVENPATIAPRAAEPEAADVILPTPAPPSESQPPAEAAPSPKIKPRPAWVVNLYIGAVALAALGLLAALFQPTPGMDWLGLGLFAGIIFLAEWLAVDIYVRDSSVSTAAALLIAGSMLFGPLGAIVLSLMLAGAAYLKHRSPFNRFVFNAANHVISGMVCIGLFRLLGLQFKAEPFLLQAGGAVLAAGLVYLSSTGLIALVIDLNTGQPFAHVWSERFRWLWPYYLAMGALAFALTFSYQIAGVAGVLATIAPLVILRFSQAQYLDHTKALVAQLREGNASLEKQADEISALNEELLLALAQAIDLRDPHVHGHSLNVARYATLIARELGLPPERVELVRKAGLLHDLGKLGISEVLLFKPDRLTLTEYEVVKQHAIIGADMIDHCRSLRALLPLVRHHHEHYNGQGYPDGLKGHAIPLEARILSVADAVDAMASDRPYRQGSTSQAILDEIQAWAGTQFDPAVVAAFRRILQHDGNAVIVNSARTVVHGH